MINGRCKLGIGGRPLVSRQVNKHRIPSSRCEMAEPRTRRVDLTGHVRAKSEPPILFGRYSLVEWLSPFTLLCATTAPF